MHNSSLKICFYFPYHEVSGVPVLFSRIANELSNSYPEIKISCIDYVDGAIARSISSDIELIPFKDGYKVSPPEDSVLVMQSILPYSIRPELNIPSTTKIVFWNLHPDCLVPSLLPFPFLRNLQNKYFTLYKVLGQTVFSKLVQRVKLFTEQLISNNALWFMDQPNLEKTNKYLFSQIQNVGFLPVPSKSSSNIIEVKTKSFERFKFCWVGRLCDFKSYILMYTIKKLSKAAQELKIGIEYNVIGDGPFKDEIQALNVNNDWFQLNVLGSMEPIELDNYLLNEVDVLTAMGTSALEGAKFGIPTILLDISYYPVKSDYMFRWLYQTKNFDLAHEISENDISLGNRSLENMLLELKRNYEVISANTLQYFYDNHEIKSFLIEFLKKIKSVDLSYGQINKEYFKRSVFRKGYNWIRGYKSVLN